MMAFCNSCQGDVDETFRRLEKRTSEKWDLVRENQHLIAHVEAQDEQIATPTAEVETLRTRLLMIANTVKNEWNSEYANTSAGALQDIYALATGEGLS